MTSESQLRVVSNRFPEVRSKMSLGGKALVKEVLERTALEIEASGPYRTDLEAKVRWIGNTGVVEVNPWWIGFIELGSVTHAPRPFAGPAAERVFKTFGLKVKALGDSL